MAQLNPENIFQSWLLSPKEEVLAGILTSLQKQSIQNELALEAARKVAMKFDPEHPQDFVQEEAEIQGKINAYRFLLDRSQECEIALENGTYDLNLNQPSGN